MTRHRRKAWAIAIAMLISVTPASYRFAFAEHRAAYDETAPGRNPAAEMAAEKHRRELMQIPGVSLVYVANDGNIVVRVKKLSHDLDLQIPKEFDGCRVKIVDVEEVMRRHRQELASIAGEDQILGFEVESFPDGVLAIVVRVRRPNWEQPIKTPTNIEGIPLRILVAQDPLTD